MCSSGGADYHVCFSQSPVRERADSHSSPCHVTKKLVTLESSSNTVTRGILHRLVSLRLHMSATFSIQQNGGVREY